MLLLLIAAPVHSQQVISFNNQGWNSDQKIDSSFSVGGFTFSSGESFYTNYGYNFNINSTSLYYVFQNPAADQIIITTPNNEPLSLINLAAYQVGEQSNAGLVIEGWYNSTLKYTQTFSENTSWKILTLNYNYINKILIRLDSMESGSLTDYDFDRFTFKGNITSVSTDSLITPKGYRLSQNFPNPFNPGTIISYFIPKGSLVTLKVFDVIGREVKTLVDGYKNAGSYSVDFNASGIASGLYFYRLQAGDYVLIKKMIVLK